jgi:uncharacterized protein YsxB (DUF464 family)
MLSVKFYKNNAHYSGFAVRGHAEYAPSGADIVCAGVSSAVNLAVNTISQLCKHYNVAYSVTTKGIVKITFGNGVADFHTAADIVLGCFEVQLKGYAAKYKKGYK